MSWRHRDILEAELHEPKGFTTANNGDSIWRNEQGLSEWTDREVIPAALNFVDASVAPPTTGTGDIYVLSLGASIHANWGTVALKDWVRYDGVSWNVITPNKSILCYDKTADVLMVYDGSAWTSVAGGGGGGSSIYTADGTLTGDRILDLDGNDLTFKNASSTIPSLTLENTNTDHTGILINKSGSLVAGEKASIDFNVSGSFSSRIENIYHGTNDMSLTFGTSSNLETFRIRNGKIIASGLGVLGAEGISLQDDTLVKGSDVLSSTSGFKVTDVNNLVFLDIKNDGSFTIGKDANDNSTNSNKNKNVVIGRNANITASSIYSAIAIGHNAQVSKSVGIAIGENATSSGIYGVAIQGSATQNHNVAIGFGSSATGNDHALAIMQGAVASANSAIAIGEESKSTGVAGLGVGWYAQSTKQYNISLGSFINNNFNNSIVLGSGSGNSTGNWLESTSTNQFTVGFRSASPTMVIGATTDSYIKSTGNLSLETDTTVKGSDTSASTTGFKVTDSTNASLLEVKNNGIINASNLPTSSAGLSSGDIWNNSGVLNIV